MSSCPGNEMEDYLRWLFNITVDDTEDANTNLCIAEALGTSNGRRKNLTKDQFAILVAMYNEYRKSIENRLNDFDDDNMSWRTYASYAFDCLPEPLYDEGAAYVRAVVTETA